MAKSVILAYLILKLNILCPKLAKICNFGISNPEIKHIMAKLAKICNFGMSNPDVAFQVIEQSKSKKWNLTLFQYVKLNILCPKMAKFCNFGISNPDVAFQANQLNLNKK